MKRIVYIFILLLLSFTVLHGKAKADSSDKKINLILLRSDSFVLTNERGEKLNYNMEKVTGNMKVYENRKFGLQKRIMTIDMSSKFTYQSKKTTSYLCLTNDQWYSRMVTQNATSITIRYSKDMSIIQAKGENLTFTLNTDSVLAEESFLTITGTGNNVEMKNSKKGIELSNLTGACDFKSNDLQYNKDSETRLCFLPIANKVQIKKPMSKKLKVAGAIPYSKKVSKTVKNVHVLPVSKTSQAVSFNKVKKAKGYVIYRQKNGGEMEQAAVLKGNGSTVWIDKNIPAGELQTYAISSYKIKDGNKVYSQKSYLVSGVVSSDMKANATKVTLNKTGKVKLKKGKTLKLKAKVTGTKGKKLVSKKVRWYSKKKSVAIVTGDGKVTALKNGTCKIYAKAHNGKNSKVVVIKVA